MCYTKYMTSEGKSWIRRLERWLDEWKIAFSGIILATRDARFLVTFGLTFVIFGTLMTLLAGSTAAFSLFGTADLWGKLRIIGDGFLGLFGVNRNFWDWILTFFVTLLQSILIGLVVMVWRRRQRSKKAQVVTTATNSDNVQNAGLAAGLAVLGTGCPTCGTTLIAPLIGTLFSTSSYALASAISGILTAAAVIIALLALKRIGNDAYSLIVSERYQKKHQVKEETNL